MEPDEFEGSHIHKWLKPRFRQDQIFYSGIANMAWKSRKRPYYTPVLFLVIKNYAERFGLVKYVNSKIEWDRSQWKISPENRDGRYPVT
jgi:hypothetical protein